MNEQTVLLFTQMTFTSTADATEQPLRYYCPESVDKPVAAMIYLHTWLGDHQQNADRWVLEAARRGWAFVQPSFRGSSNTPQGCGSPLALADVVDATRWAMANLPLDPQRIYLAGGSGGGHMAMRMAGHAPELYAAVSEWCGIASLVDWYHEHCVNGKPVLYAEHIQAATGGPPGSSAEVDAQYFQRSPIHHLTSGKDLPIDFNHGVFDGKKGSVPAHHSIDAFNIIAQAHHAPVVTPQEIEQLWEHHRLNHPQPQDTTPDADFGERQIYLRRYAGSSRLTIFEGGHDAIPFAACQWLAKHTRDEHGQIQTTQASNDMPAHRSSNPAHASSTQGQSDSIAS